MSQDTDSYWMQQALSQAEIARQQNEVPIGAVVVLDNKIIGAGFNQPISSSDPTAHAEIIALRNAAKNIGNYRLLNTTVYVTLEPCAMCYAALIHARIGRLVYAASDSRDEGAKPWNHKFVCEHGLLANKASKLLKDFFATRR